VDSLSDEDWWSRWFGRRRRPFFGRRFWDIDEAFRDMEEMMEREFKDLFKDTPKNLIRERTLPDGRKVREMGPFVYGYSMTVGPDGKPQIREFGNIKTEMRRGRPRINMKEEREPLTDVLRTDDEVKVVVELPGVEKKDVKLHGTENNLTISVDTPQYKFHKDIGLPAKVDPKTAKTSYKNGVLEVTLAKKKEEKPKGEPIKIE
jgi:HSP20 family protein